VDCGRTFCIFVAVAALADSVKAMLLLVTFVMHVACGAKDGHASPQGV